MRNIYLKKSTSIFAVLNYLFLFFTTAISAATPYGTNIVTNGDAETADLTGWTASGTAAAYFTTSTSSVTDDGANNVFELYRYTGYFNQEATLSQTIDISDLSTTISSGLVYATASGQLFNWWNGGSASITVIELDASNNVLVQHTNGVIYPAQNANSPTVWTTYALSIGVLQTNTRKLKIELYAHTSSTSNDDYVDFDNIQLILSNVPSITTTSISTFDATSATMGGNVTADGGATVTERGVVYSSTDATPTIGETGVTKDANGTGIGTFSKSITGLSGNTTYYVCAYTTNSAGTSYGTVVSFKTLTPGTWTGNASNSEWNNASNWSDNQVPTATTDVIIPSSGITYLPMILSTETAECKNLTAADDFLEITSTSSGTGSLIVHGIASGKVKSNVYLTAAQWHIVAPPVDGANISLFMSNEDNHISSKVNGATTNYAIADYNEGSNAWYENFTNATSGTFFSGIGYTMRRDYDNSVCFYGDLVTGTKNVNLTKTGEGWNCIGNPYTSAIGMNASASSTENFLTKNSSIFDPSYACVYIWDPVSSTYKILGNLPSGLSSERLLSQNYIQVGQAFFVKAKDASQTASFTAAMQSHQNVTNAPFKAPAVRTSWPCITITATGVTTNASAIITFNEKMTNGLNPTYDAGLLRGTNGLSLYTRLLEDNGVDFAVQCLPEEYSNLVIPVGLDCKDGGEITFSARTVELPSTCTVILEDKTANTFTSLEGDATYKATVGAGTTPVGRFYIHTSVSTTTGMSGLNSGIAGLKAYIANEAIIIEGSVSDQATATLFDVQGRKIWVKPLLKGVLNTLPCSDLLKGMYVLSIQQKNETVTKKVVKE